MLPIVYIFAISTTFAFRDYFANVADLTAKLNNGQVMEVFEPAIAQQVFNSDEIQVISLAVHGGKIESETEVFSKMLYEKAISIRGKSALYNFLSNINSKQSGSYYTGRCIPTHCCKEISYPAKKDKRDKKDNKKNYGDGSTCKSFKVEKEFEGKLTEKEECDYEEVCYLNAGHVTSENFRTKKLNELLHCRYPVSFHGFQDRNDKKGSPVDIVLGGLSNQKYKLAEAYHKFTGGAIRVAICRSANNCRVYDPNQDFDKRIKVNGAGLTGSSSDNFVNLGEHKCGLQLELSTSFRNSTLTSTEHWECLVKEIFNTLPNRGEEVCDDKSLYDKASIDTDDEFP